jgi:hypothetical protein
MARNPSTWSVRGSALWTVSHLGSLTFGRSHLPVPQCQRTASLLQKSQLRGREPKNDRGVAQTALGSVCTGDMEECEFRPTQWDSCHCAKSWRCCAERHSACLVNIDSSKGLDLWVLVPRSESMLIPGVIRGYRRHETPPGNRSPSARCRVTCHSARKHRSMRVRPSPRGSKA